MQQRTLFDDLASSATPADDPPSFPSRRVAPGSQPELVPLSALIPDTPVASGRGIARMAAAAPELRQRNDVEYRELPCRSLLSRCNSRRVPIDYSINPYRGCEFGCVYCYARYTHEYMEFEDWIDFERKVFVKSQAQAALVEDLRRLDLRGKSVALGTATDPYQPAERIFGITRQLLEVFAARRGLRLSITTKSDLITRDLELLQRVNAGNQLHVNVTITTPHYQLSRRLEPRAPRPDKRFQAVQQLAQAGICVGVFLMPVLPRINDRPEDLELLIRTAREHGARYLITQTLFLRDCSRKRVFPFLAERFPEVLPTYQRLYSRSGTRELEQYARTVLERIQWLKRKYGLDDWRQTESELPAGEDQLQFGNW